jgi:uncharacterized protein YkwD
MTVPAEAKTPSIEKSPPSSSVSVLTSRQEDNQSVPFPVQMSIQTIPLPTPSATVEHDISKSPKQSSPLHVSPTAATEHLEINDQSESNVRSISPVMAAAIQPSPKVPIVTNPSPVRVIEAPTKTSPSNGQGQSPVPMQAEVAKSTSSISGAPPLSWQERLAKVGRIYFDTPELMPFP